MTARVEYHTEIAAEFLDKARVYLEEGDLLQASEKGWGAAAQMVKAVAEQRGWPHSGHRELWVAVNRLTAQTEDEEIRTNFGLAHNLHINFYDGLFPPETVDAYLANVNHFVARLRTLLD